MFAAVSNVPDDSGTPDPHVFQIGGVSFEEPPSRARAEQPVAVAVTEARPVAVPVCAPISNSSAPIPAAKLISQLRARLRVVEREIKARKKLEAERDQIKRLIAAADNERNNLRAIRAAG